MTGIIDRKMAKSPARRKHIPVRMCVVCRTKGDKRALTRLVRTAEGVELDPSGKMNGRGAYVCDDRDCWERVVNTKILNQALNMNMTEQDRVRLQQAMP